MSEGSGDHPTLFSIGIATRWSDMDADNRINNLIVLRYAEEARMQWAASLELNELAPDLMPVVATVGGVFHSPIGYPSMLNVEIACSHLGTSSLQLIFRILDTQQPSTHYATATATWVWVEKATLRPAPMPGKLREICQPRMASG